MVVRARLTSFLCRSGDHIYPKRELRSGNNPESDGDVNVFHCNGIYPVTPPSGIGSKAINNDKGSKPDRQHNLGDEGADDEHEDGVERCFVASISVGTKVR